jgi:hypothetical protein
MMKLPYRFFLLALVASSANAFTVTWNKDAARENAVASISWINKTSSAIQHHRNIEKVHLPTLDRLIAGFHDQYDAKNPAVDPYESCLAALEYFQPYATVSLKPNSPGKIESMSSSKKAYEEELHKCVIATKR